MIFSGAIVAAGLSQGASVSIGLDTGFLKRFRSDAGNIYIYFSIYI